MRALLLFGTLSFYSCLAAAIEPPAEAKRYYDLLRTRPQAGTVFDRMADAWLASSATESLLDFLKAQAAAADAKAVDHFLLGLQLSREGSDSEALAAVTKALALEPSLAIGWTERAQLEMRLMDFDAALKSLDSAIAIKADIKTAELRGRVLLRTGKPEAALTAWRELLAAHPDDEELAEEIVELQLDEGLQSEAIDTMAALVIRTKDAAESATRRLRLAEIFLRAAKKAEALKELGTCLAQSGAGTWMEAEAIAQIDAAFRREDDLTGLAAHLEALPEKDRPGVQSHLARVLADAGQADRAVAVHLKLLERTPGVRDLRERYLDLLERIGKFPEAIAQTKLLIEQNAGDKELQIRLANLHQQAGDTASADAALVDYLAAKDTAEFDHLRVARLLEQWGRNDAARTAYAQLSATFPDSAGAREAQAQFLHRVGDRDAALEIWKGLAAKGSFDDLLSVAQTLLARLEPEAARDVLKARFAEFSKDERFLAPLVTASIALKEFEPAQPWALDRVLLSGDPALLDDAIRQALQVLNGAVSLKAVLADLKKQPPTSFAARALLASLLEADGDRIGAEKTLQEAPPSDATAAQERLISLIRSRQDWERAALEAEKLLAMPQGKTSQNLQALVDLKQRAGAPDEALKWIAEWKKVGPGAVLPWTTEAALLKGLGKDKESLAVLRTAARKFEDDVLVAGQLAAAFVEAGQFADGERIFLRLMEQADETPEKLRWVAQLAQVATSRGLLRKVKERFEERQRTNRADATPWLALAEINRVGNDQREQRRCLAEAVRLRPKDVELMQQVARVDEDLGDWKKAIVELDKAALIDTTPRSKQMAAMVQIRWGDEQAGLQQLIALLGGPQMDADDALKIADKMMALGDWVQAEKFLAPFVERDPADYRLRYCWAVAASEVPNTEAALAAFVRVATASEERAEVLKRQAKTPPVSSYLDRFAEGYPPGMKLVMEVVQANYSARRHTFGANYSQRQGSAYVSIPPNVEAARAYAMAYLVALGQDLEEKKRLGLIASLKSQGWPMAEALFACQQNPQTPWSFSVDESSLKAHPDDALLHVLWLTSAVNFGRDTPQVSGELSSYQQANALLGEKYPGVAMVATVGALQTDLKAALPLLDDTLDRWEKITPGSLTNFVYIPAMMLGGGQRIADSVPMDLPEPERKRITQLLVRESKAFDATPVNPAALSRPAVIHYTSNALRASKDWTGYLALWDWVFAELKTGKPERRKALQTWPTYAGNQQTPLLAPLGFPVNCSALPGLFATMMNHSDASNTHIEQWRCAGPEDDYQGLIPLLDSIKDPDLRLVLAFKADQMAVVEKELAARLAQTSVRSDDLLLAAGYYGYKEDFKETISLLVRCLSMPMDANLRPAADAALVHSITALPDSERGKLPATALAAAKQAARRLRNPKMPPNQRDEWVAAMSALGLKDEAEQWTKLVGPPPATSTSNQSFVSSSSSRSNASRLDKMIKAGDVEGAARAAINDIKALIGRYGQGNFSYIQRQAKEVMKKLTLKGAKEKLLELIDPGDGASEARVVENGQLLEILADGPKALKTYEAAFERFPKSAAIRMRLLILYATADPAKADAMLSGIPWQELARGTGGELISVLRNTNDTPFAARMKLLGSITRYLDKLAATDLRPPPGGLTWATQLPGAAASYDNDRSVYLPGLHVSRLSSNSAYRNPSKPALEERRAVHDALCKVLMKHPSVASDAFASLVALAIRENADLKPWADQAKKILREFAEEKASGKIFRTNAPSSTWGQNRADNWWQPWPADFLVWLAWKEGKPERIADEVLPLAEKALTRDQLKELRAWSELWTVPADQMPSAALRYALAPHADTYNGASNAVFDVLDCCAQRKLPGQTMDDVFTMALSKTQVQDGVLAYFLSVRAAVEPDTAKLVAITRQFLPHYLGIESGWQKRLTAFLDQRYGRGSSGNWDEQADTVVGMVNKLLDAPETLALGVQLATSLGLIDHEGWRRNEFESQIERLAKEPEAAFALLKVSPLLGDAGAYATWEGKGNSPLMAIAAGFKNRPQDRDALIGMLKKEAPRTVGLDLTEAMLASAPAQSLPKVLKAHAADLAKIPPERHGEIANLITHFLPAVKQPGNLDPEVRKALEPLMATQFKEQENRVDTWMKAATLAELKVTDRAAAEELKKLTGELSLKAPEQARALFLHGCDLLEQKEAQSGLEAVNCGNGWLLRSELLSDTMEKSGKLESLILMLRLCHEDETGKLTLSGWSNVNKMGQSVMEVWRTNGGQGNTGRGLRAVCDRLNKGLGKVPPTLLANVFYDVVSKLPQNLRVPSIRWAQTLKDPALSALAKEFEMAGRFFLATDVQTRTNPNAQKALAELGGLEPVWQHYQARLDDESENPRVRQALGHHLCYRAPLHIPAALVQKSAALALTAMKERHCIHGYQYGWIMQAWTRLPADDAWKLSAQEHWDAWVARCAAKPRSDTLEYHPADWTILAMLRMAAHAGNDEWLDKLMADFHETLGNEPSALPVLVAAGAEKAAISWLTQQWAESVYDYEKGLNWSAEVGAGLPAFRKACGDEGLAFLGELMIALLPDPPKSDQADIPGFQPRTARIVDLAKKLPSIKFSDPAMRTRCLEYFGTVYETFEPLAKEFDEAAGKIDIPRLVEMDSTREQYHRVKPLNASTGRQAWSGNSKPAIDAYNAALAAPAGRSPYYKDYMLKEIAWFPLWASIWKYARTEKADWPKLLPLVDHLLTKVPPENYADHFADALCLFLLIHHADGTQASIEAWEKSLTAETRQKFTAALSGRFQLWEMVKSYGGLPQPRIPVAKRAELVASLLSNSWVRARYPDAAQPPSNLITHLVTRDKVFTPAELVEAWKPIATAHPRKGRTAGEAADILAGAGKLPEAIAAMQLAVAQTQEKDYGASVGFVFRKAEFMERMKDKDGALKLLAALDAKRLSPQQATQRGKVQDRLSK